MIHRNSPIIISGLCDVCQKKFSREKLSTEKENGWPTRLTDETAPIKIVCGDAVCTAERTRLNKQHRNKKSNKKHNSLNPARNFDRNTDAIELYAQINDRFQITKNNNAYFHAILKAMTAKVIRDRNVTGDKLFSLMRLFSDKSINLEVDHRGVVKKGFWQCWYQYAQDFDIKLHELFRQKNPVTVASNHKKKVSAPDDEVDFVYEWLVHGKHSLEDLITFYSDRGIFMTFEQPDELYFMDEVDDTTFYITNLKATKFKPGKVHTLDVGYELVSKKASKEALAQILEATEIRLNNLKAFSNYLNQCSPLDLTMYAVLKDRKTRYKIKPQSWLSLQDIETDAFYSRTKDNFYRPTEPGILFLDFDSIESFVTAIDDLYRSVPILRKFSYVMQPSSSANVYMGFNNVTGERGLHVYFLVDDSSMVPSLTQTINERSILAGYGRLHIHSDGSTSVRGLVDTAVTNMAGIDYTCSPILHRGLSQDRKAIYVQGESDVVPSSYIKPLSLVERKLLADKIAFLKGDTQESAVSTARRGVTSDSRFLDIDDTVKFVSGHPATVRQIIANPAKYANRKVVCPHSGRVDCAKLFVNKDGSILINSFDDNRTYMLKGNSINTNNFTTTVKTIEEPVKQDVAITKPMNVQKRTGTSKIIAA